MPYTTQEIKQIWSTVNDEKDWWMVLDRFQYLMKYFPLEFRPETIQAFEKYGDFANLRIYNNGINNQS
jgi:hypothetical protein